MSPALAYAACERDVRAHYENFPVASILIPRSMRHHVAAVYAFARAADDFADEGERTSDERHGLLDRWRRRLRQAAAQGEPVVGVWSGEPPHAHAIFTALGATIREKALPIELFEDLLSAFDQDVHVRRYATWDDVFDYCRRSANPVGRLVLRIAGYRAERFDEWSDGICTGLQLANFWQDVKVDYDRGRIYLPTEEMRLHGASEAALADGVITREWHQALKAAVSRTRRLFECGRPLCDAVHGRLRYELRATWLGGTRILDRLEHAAFDVVHRRPRLGLIDAPWFVRQMLVWPLHGNRPARAASNSRTAP